MHGEGRGVGEEEGHTERAVGGGRRNGWEEGEDRKRKKGEKEEGVGSWQTKLSVLALIAVAQRMAYSWTLSASIRGFEYMWY